MQDNRRLFTDNEKQVLFDEVYGRCPVCGKRLTHSKSGRIYRTFEVAHIYPANPKPEEVELLAEEERLSDDVDYFEFIRQCFSNIDKETPYKFSTIAAQIKSFYSKCMQINDNQEIVYYASIH